MKECCMTVNEREVKKNEFGETCIHARINPDGSFEMNIEAKNKEEFRDLCSFMNEVFEKY